MTTYITADLHYGHRRILELQPERRALLGLDASETSVAAHDAQLYLKLLEWVPKGSELIVLGDLALDSRDGTLHAVYMVSQVVGDQGRVLLLPGNHDEKHLRAFRPLPGWPRNVELGERIVTRRDHGAEWVLCHYPLEVWPGMAHRPDGGATGRNAAVHLHGHSHGRGRRLCGRLDVGLDAVGRPLTLHEALLRAEEPPCPT